MNDEWKDKPHWVLRFNEIGMWELTGPDGEAKHIKGLAERDLTVRLNYLSVPEFSMDGILFTRI